MGFMERLIMSVFAGKALKEIANVLSDEPPVSAQNSGSRASYGTLRKIYHDTGDFPPSLLGELLRREPDFTDKKYGEDVRELLGIQATQYWYKGVLYTGDTWFTISVGNRFLCRELLNSTMDRNFRDHDLIDYSDRLFSPVADPAQHAITIGDYTLVYKYALYYNLTLMLLADADRQFLSGKRTAQRAVCCPKVQITQEIVSQYGLAVDENARIGMRFGGYSYAVLDDFNSPDANDQRTGWFEVRIIDGSFRSDSAVPLSIGEMRRRKRDVAQGTVWPSIIPGHVFFETEYVSAVPFGFLEDADALTIRGNEQTCELYVCRLAAGWGGIIFRLRNKGDYYTLAAWLIPMLSCYCSITRGWNEESLIREYWPTYPSQDPS